MATQMVRKQFYLHRRQEILLKRLSEARGVSEAEIIRQAIESEFRGEAKEVPGGESALDAFVRMALDKRDQPHASEPYRWDREEIYAARNNRLLRDPDEK